MLQQIVGAARDRIFHVLAERQHESRRVGRQIIVARQRDRHRHRFQHVRVDAVGDQVVRCLTQQRRRGRQRQRHPQPGRQAAADRQVGQREGDRIRIELAAFGAMCHRHRRERQHRFTQRLGAGQLRIEMHDQRTRCRIDPRVDDAFEILDRAFDAGCGRHRTRPQPIAVTDPSTDLMDDVERSEPASRRHRTAVIGPRSPGCPSGLVVRSSIGPRLQALWRSVSTSACRSASCSLISA